MLLIKAGSFLHCASACPLQVSRAPRADELSRDQQEPGRAPAPFPRQECSDTRALLKSENGRGSLQTHHTRYSSNISKKVCCLGNNLVKSGQIKERKEKKEGKKEASSSGAGSKQPAPVPPAKHTPSPAPGLGASLSTGPDLLVPEGAFATLCWLACVPATAFLPLDLPCPDQVSSLRPDNLNPPPGRPFHFGQRLSTPQ